MKKIFLFLVLFSSAFATAQSSYFITGAGGAKLHVTEYGHGKPVVILAGGPGLNPVYLELVWKNLSNKYRCIVLDQRGTGESTLAVIDSSTINMKNYVADLDSLRNYLKLDRLTLVGHSWGGMLSMEYASRRPGHTERLILLGSGGPTKKFFSYFGDNINMRLNEEDKKEVALYDSLKQRSLKGIWPGYFFDRKRAIATEPQDDNKMFGQPGISKYAIKDFVATEKERASLLKNFKGTVFLIQGRQDPVGASTAFEIKSILSQSQIHFIEKCGHMPWLENDIQVKEFFDLINESLK